MPNHPHKKTDGTLCYSQKKTVTNDEFIFYFHCTFCDTSWTRPRLAPVVFINGELQLARDFPRTPKDLRRADRNLAWMIRHFGRAANLPQEILSKYGIEKEPPIHISFLQPKHHS